jgi:quinol monooxygenase YgiN
MTTVTEGRYPLTVINIFTVTPDKQADVVRMLSEMTENTVRHHAGFISTSIHTSLDGTKVTNYAQWESKEHLEAMLGNTDAQQQMRELTMIATSQPHIYEVARVYEK